MPEISDYSVANLRKLRSESGMSRQELLDRLESYGIKMHANTIRRIEAGEQPIKVREAVAISEIFAIDLNALVTQPLLEADAMVSNATSEVEFMLRQFTNVAEMLLSSWQNATSVLESPDIPAPVQSQRVQELWEAIQYAVFVAGGTIDRIRAYELPEVDGEYEDFTKVRKGQVSDN